MISRLHCWRCSRLLVQLILLTLTLIILRSVNAVQCLEIKNVDASLENVYRFPIIQGQRHILVYATGSNLDSSELDGSRNVSQTQKIVKHAIKVVCTARHKHDPECPLIITVTQKSSVVFWKTAAEDSSSFLGNGTIISNSERTICLENDSLEDMMFTVELSTCSKNLVNYTLSVHMRNDLITSMNQVTKAQIMPSSPAVYYFPQLTKNVNRPGFIYIHLTSTPENCMIMSIQHPNCPVADTVETMLNHGQWQTVSVKTGMTVSVEDFPLGFFIVFLLLPEDTWCNHASFGQNEVGSITSNMLKVLPTAQTTIRKKSIHFTIRDKSPTSGFAVAILVPLALFAIYISIVFVIHSHFHQLRCKDSKRDNVTYHHASSTASSFNPNPVRIDSVEISHQCPGKMGGSTDSVVRSRIQIAELINSHPERLMVQSKRYFLAGVLCASFYCVPVFQLILSYHKRLRETGNFDLCYFNYMCSHMLGMFHDFNHIFSNVGYCICGLAFMAIVFVRQVTVIKTLPPQSRKPSITEDDVRLVVSSASGKGKPVPVTKVEAKIGTITQLMRRCWPRAHWDISRGVFVHHGLFYAMGLSLFLTGLMSAAYHICPNQNNFQFDTSFMYTIAALGCVTIYTFRHPTYVSASMTFLVLAAVAASTVVGLLWESNKFRLFFTVTHIMFLVMLLVYIHYVGHVRVNGVCITEWKQMFIIIREKWRDDIKRGRILGFQHDTWNLQDAPDTRILPGPSRLIFPILVVIVNSAALTMIWIVMPTTNFASQLLAVYVINCSCYTVYYSIMKMVHFECRGKLWVQPGIYLTLSGVLWTWALSYFGDEVTVWDRSPAESRAKNADCVFLGFYDSHDIWHFLSSAALFSSMMSLLTMDDDLIETPKSEIPVF